MANEYKLQFTASEIDEKLAQIAEIDNAVSDLSQELLAEVTYAGYSVNISDGQYEYGYLSNTGELIDAEPSQSAFRTVNYIPVEGGKTLCWNRDSSTVGTNTAKVVQYDESYNCIVEMTDIPEEVNRWTSNGITLNASTKFVRVAFYTETAADLATVQLNLFYHEDIEAAFADPGATFQQNPIGGSSAVGKFVPQTKIQSPLTGKKIIYDGDSICESRIFTSDEYINLNNGGGYAKLIADRVSGRYENHAVGGSMLASWNGEDGIASRISELPTDGDLYCFEGGINDFWNGVPLGTDTYHEYEYGGITRDTLSVLGALDYIFYYATTHFVGKPICFVISHHIVDPDDTADCGDYTYQELHDAIVKVCKKWAIPYYDAYYTSGLCGKNEVQSNAYLTANASGTGDGCHPNEEGYKRYYVPQLIDLFERIMPVE